MAIVINADSQTVLILDRDDRGDNHALALLASQAAAQPAPNGARPRDYAAAMRMVEAEVY